MSLILRKNCQIIISLLLKSKGSVSKYSHRTNRLATYLQIRKM
ncbi:hypothetical protein HMPREF9151_00850 [Hoylesella saccharolytica F0055]|uniref:Uncharacterized protein n=1 Tax=Hoylesella saccharolytica F0055 TaxID=1127699 RepID=L1NFP3_9BACT|nr:hypothetical protein HMPREF9151_00850 [Hoylesella saccharolytica F0055]